MKLLGPMPDVKVKPTPYNVRHRRRGAVRQRAWHRLRHECLGRRDRAAAREDSPAAARRSSLDPAQNNTYRALNRAWKSGASVQFASGRYLVSGLSRPAQTDLVKSLALVAERTSASGAAVKKPRIGLFQSVEREHGRRLDALGPRAVRIRVRDAASRRTSRRRSRAKWTS